MWIMTKDGWKQLSPQVFASAGHVPSLLEQMGITKDYNGVKGMVEYCRTHGNGYYFTYRDDGTAYQSRPAVHPLRDMYGES